MKKIDKIANFIFELAFIVIITGGWVFGITAYIEVSKLEKQYQADLEELEMDLNDKFYSIETAISDLKDRMEKFNDRITEAQHDLATDKITLEEYNDLVERIEELEEIANAFDDLEDALEKALNEINARLDALEELK